MRELEPETQEVNSHQQGIFDHEKPVTPAPAQLDPEAAQLGVFASPQTETLCADVGALSKMLQQRPDVIVALGDALQSSVHAQTELFRTRHGLLELEKSECTTPRRLIYVYVY
ncbi:MAG: hypothetical protein VB140_10440 [Burkholderia sp.]|nr:MAG: hypothetical protein E5299_02350 [Burkholderia gladioli]